MAPKTHRIAVLAFSLIVSTLAYAENQTITLKDGSQIKGELVSVKDGSYTIKTPMMGDVIINRAQVTNISNSGSAVLAPSQALPVQGYSASAAPVPTGIPPQLANIPGLPSAGTFSPDVQAAQNRLLTDPAMMADLQSLAQDPEMMKILADPALIQAVTAKDVNAVQSNPNAQALMNNPKMKALIQKLQSSSNSSTQ